MVAGADSIDDLAVLRAGSTEKVLSSQVMAPSTIGTWLRSLRIGHIGQLDKVFEEAFIGAWQAGARPADGSRVELDIDSSVHGVYGDQKQGASFAYNNE